MNRTLAIALLALVVFTSAVILTIHYQHKREDAVAYFALDAIHKAKAACYKDSEPEDCNAQQKGAAKADYYAMGECLGRNMSRGIHKDACETDEKAALQRWAVKYPRQAAQRQAAILNEERKRDAADMNKRQ